MRFNSFLYLLQISSLVIEVHVQHKYIQLNQKNKQGFNPLLTPNQATCTCIYKIYIFKNSGGMFVSKFRRMGMSLNTWSHSKCPLFNLIDELLLSYFSYWILFFLDELDNPLHPENIRSLVNEQQADILSQTYANNPTPSLTKCRELRSETGLRIDTIQTWFREKRFRDKRFMENDEKISYGKESNI